MTPKTTTKQATPKSEPKTFPLQYAEARKLQASLSRFLIDSQAGQHAKATIIGDEMIATIDQVLGR